MLSAISVAVLLAVSGAGTGTQEAILLKTDSFILGVGIDGHVTSFVDAESGTDYYDPAAGAVFAAIRAGGQAFPATAAILNGDLLTVNFGNADGQAVFRVVPGPHRLAFEVVSFSCEQAEELTFAHIPLSLKGTLDEPFGVSPLALNLNTNCGQIPGLNPGLAGFIACRRFGFVGARGAIIAGPVAGLREALKDAVAATPDLPRSSLGGPWALDGEINQDSYLIAMEGTVTEDNVGAWIEAARYAGTTQIDLHGGEAFRWGDYEVKQALYPRGRESLKAVVDTIHNAGLAVGLHTYAFFIAKDAPWVTPVPDPRLDSDAVFTLAGNLAEQDAVVPVAESTEAMSAVTGFHVRNSVTLRIDDELITYADIGKQAPYAFNGCVRGACGTKAAPHAQGAKVYHLKECFGLFVPQGDSSLFEEVAQRTADLYNACGFDMLYLDALDGSDILAGGENAWHYQARFVYELNRRLNRPAVMEMSTFSHHLWCVRSRMQAWDCPARGMKDFVDCHVLDNLKWKSAFLPTHLGWWGCFDWGRLQPERTMPDDMEYLCVKALATDSSLSYIVGFAPGHFAQAHTQQLAAIAQRYESLRRAGTVPDSIKAQLVVPRSEFALETADDGLAQFRPVQHDKHIVAAGREPEQLEVDNPYAAQPLRLRIEALVQPGASDAPESIVFADARNAVEFGPVETQEGVSASLEPMPQGKGDGDVGMAFIARNTDIEPTRAWAAFRKEFVPTINLANRGLGLWVEGDGQGEVLNVQLRSPKHLAGGLADHYIHIDFTGKRYFALVEPEAEELSQYEWAHTRRWIDWQRNPVGISAFAYPMYHIWVVYDQIASLTIGVNNIPAGKSVQVGLGCIKALPLQTAKLANPAVTLGAATLTFPVELESGSYLEFLAMDDCKVYDAAGNCTGEVTPVGTVPTIASGKNACEFGNASQPDGPARARVTVTMCGEPLHP